MTRPIPDHAMLDRSGRSPDWLKMKTVGSDILQGSKIVDVPLTGKRKLANPLRNRVVGGAERHETEAGPPAPSEPHDPRRLGIEFSVFQIGPDGHLG
jgi:hypothetical protein